MKIGLIILHIHIFALDKIVKYITLLQVSLSTK